MKTWKEIAKQAKENRDYSLDFMENLSMEEIEFLKKDIEKWNKEDFVDAQDTLSDHYGLNPSKDFLIELFQNNFEMAFENVTGGISDTCASSKLIEAVLKKIGVKNSWPCYGDSKQYKKEFVEELRQKMEKSDLNQNNTEYCDELQKTFGV